MAKHYLKEWRKHRKLTQEDVMDRLEIFDDPALPTTAATLSRIENGRQGYSERILEALSEVYDTPAGQLISRNPLKEGEVIDFMQKLTEREQIKLRTIWEAIKEETA